MKAECLAIKTNPGGSWTGRFGRTSLRSWGRETAAHYRGELLQSQIPARRADARAGALQRPDV